MCQTQYQELGTQWWAKQTQKNRYLSVCWFTECSKCLYCCYSVTQSWPTLSTPWTVAHQAPPSMGFSQARILEWAAISFTRGSSQPRDWTCISCIGRQFFTTDSYHVGSPSKCLILNSYFETANHAVFIMLSNATGSNKGRAGCTKEKFFSYDINSHNYDVNNSGLNKFGWNWLNCLVETLWQITPTLKMCFKKLRILVCVSADLGKWLPFRTSLRA